MISVFRASRALGMALGKGTMDFSTTVLLEGLGIGLNGGLKRSGQDSLLCRVQ